MTVHHLAKTVLTSIVLLAGVVPQGSGQPAGLEVSRTAYGVVHVRARDYRGLGYGLSYSHAQDNVCLMADYVVSVNGERSRYFGAEEDQADNPQKDLFARYYLNSADLDPAYGRMSQTARDLISGYVAGYNDYLAHTGKDKLPADCRNAPWVRPISAHDIYLMLEDKNILMSGSRFVKPMVAASPPGKASAAENRIANFTLDLDESAAQMGSNGWAFGGDTTGNGRGLVVGNPHFPWRGNNRFYQVHLTIPGEYDVMGATIPPLPLVAIGFNRDVAWTHTVSTGRRFTLFELTLDPDDPLTYFVDGKKHHMTPIPVSVEVRRPDGALETRDHVFYQTLYGPVISLLDDGLTWSRSTAYALGDVNKLNTDAMQTWLAIGKARSVGDIRAALGASVGLQWVNTLAADRHGDALYADISRTPNVSEARLRDCAPSPSAARLSNQKRLFVLDGSDSVCNWLRPGNSGTTLLATGDLPSILRRDYVANSNNSYWLANDKKPFAKKSPLIGNIDEPQNLRARQGLLTITERIERGNISLDVAREMQFDNGNLAAHLVLDDFLPLCGEKPELARACAILQGWDRRENLDSRGAVLFREFWARLRRNDNLFTIPFDRNDPLRTPRKLSVAGAAVRDTLFSALEDAIQAVTANGFALDVPLGEAQVFVGEDARVPLHGGPGVAGVLNVMRTGELTPRGYTPVHGASYIQIVTFDDKGPVADAMLAYAQSVDPASPHYADQTRLYSRKQFYRLPFHRADILADPAYRVVELP